MFCMTEHEKLQQIGGVAEEVSELKAGLNHITEKLTRAFTAYQLLTQGQSPNNWRVEGGKVIVPSMAGRAPGQPTQLEALLNEHELIEVLEKRQRITEELNAATARLRGLVPHLL
jgi:hypothetical protein